MIFPKYILIFVIFSFIGWIWEAIYTVIKTNTWVNRGFLIGPVCPIYGFSVLFALIFFNRYITNQVVHIEKWKVFLFSFFASAIIEYITSFILEKIFHALWWDYHDMPLNINGRVCLPASIFFGALGVLFIYMIFPFIDFSLAHINPIVVEVLSYLFLIIFIADLTLTLNELYGLNMIIKRIDKSLNDSISHNVSVYFDKQKSIRNLVLSKIQVVKYSDKVKDTLNSIKNNILGEKFGFKM